MAVIGEVDALAHAGARRRLAHRALVVLQTVIERMGLEQQARVMPREMGETFDDLGQE